MAIKAIFLDLGNVLVRLKDREFLRRMKRACPDLTLNQFESALLSAGSPHLEYEMGKLDAAGFHRRLVKELGLTWGLQEFVENWVAFFTPNRPMELAVASLKPLVKVWLISNTNAEHWAAVRERYKVVDQLDGAVLSHVEGLRKPDAAIFNLALARAGVKASEAFYVDDLEQNVEAAKLLGMRSFLYRFNDAPFRAALEAQGLSPRWIPGRTLAKHP
jgi:putative hydrolase of the HAD superfamily